MHSQRKQRILYSQVQRRVDRMLDISTFLIKFHMLWLSFKQKVPKQEQKDLRKSKLFIIPHTMKDYSSESDQDFG